MNHDILMGLVAKRVADPRILRLVQLWLRAGVLESGAWKETDRGTPQGAGISPLLANIVLHDILDLWVQQWRRRRARGRVVIVRHADDFVIGFQREADARAMLSELGERLAVFGLTLHERKTRLIGFGRFAATSRSHRGERRPETFAFLGFTRYGGWTRDGRFIVEHKTQSKRLTRKLKALRKEAWRLMHAPLATRHRWYAAVLIGHYGLLRTPPQLPCARQLSPRSPTHLVHVPQAPQPEEPEDVVERVRRPDVQLHLAGPPDHTTMDATPGMTRVTFRRSRVRESRTPGSVRAKPNGRDTRPRSLRGPRPARAR